MKKIILMFMAIACMVTITACGTAAGMQQPPETAVSSLPVSSVSSGASVFTDIPMGAWYEEAVIYCLEHGILSGTSDTVFSPDDSMTRAMLAQVLYRMSGNPAVSATSGFSDVPEDSWYADAVAWASERNYISGYGNDTFGANDAVTREQMAAILWRYAGSPAADTSTKFADADSISQWAAPAVSWAKLAGIISGKDNNRFAPKEQITRAEAAVMLYRFVGGSGNKEEVSDDNTLVVYFSGTGTTKPLAEYTADIMSADLYEIVPELPYTQEDLTYYTNGRADREQNDPSARPAISGSVANMEQYDVVFLAYPIWHGQAPKIISTFLESYDFSGKTIVPFCTSHSSGIGSSDTNLHALASNANWLSGRRFAAGTSKDTMEEWINGLDLPQSTEAVVRSFDFDTKRVTLNSGYQMPINGIGTYSLHGEECINAITVALNSGVRLIDTAHAYGNEEEIGEAIRSSGVPREEIFVITKLYPDQFANPEAAIEESLQKLDIGYVDMMLLHHPGTGDVAAYKAMEQAVADGKIRSIGLSNWYVEELGTFLPQVNTTPALVQNEIHPYYQENDVIPYIQNLGIVVQGWYPLGGRGHTAELLGDEVIASIAATHGKSSAQVILRWNLQKGVVVIPGSSNPDHIQENTELFDFELTSDEMAQINALDRGEKHDWY